MKHQARKTVPELPGPGEMVMARDVIRGEWR